jgi:8-oxo-dGTP diphosphatase
MVGPSRCAWCGTLLSGPVPTTCTTCGRGVFNDARPSASAVIVDGGRFLAVRRARPPAAGGLDLPGGFCGGEHPEIAVRREVAEETGLTIELGVLVGIYMDDHDPDGVPTMNLYYLARVVPGSVVEIDEGEVTAIEWHDLASPPPLAFSHQQAMIHDAAVWVAAGAASHFQ